MSGSGYIRIGAASSGSTHEDYYGRQRSMNPSKRAFDLFLSLTLVITFSAPIATLSLMIKLTQRGPLIFWSDRVGRLNVIFRMPKFRTMRIDTPSVATHLLPDPECWLTPFGSLLRKTSLDELPQLWSILKGDMSFVGPRPALFNQDDLVALRTERGIHLLTPGLTGWAQINGRDELTIAEKVEFDAEYRARQSFLFDLKILWLTLLRVMTRDAISH